MQAIISAHAPHDLAADGKAEPVAATGTPHRSACGKRCQRCINTGLRAAGWSDDAPVLVVHKASWPGEERIVRGTLATIKQQCRDAGIVSQAMVIASPTLGARHWPELTRSRLYDPGFTHRFRKATT